MEDDICASRCNAVIIPVLVVQAQCFPQKRDQCLILGASLVSWKHPGKAANGGWRPAPVHRLGRLRLTRGKHNQINGFQISGYGETSLTEHFLTEHGFR